MSPVPMQMSCQPEWMDAGVPMAFQQSPSPPREMPSPPLQVAPPRARAQQFPVPLGMVQQPFNVMSIPTPQQMQMSPPFDLFPPQFPQMLYQVSPPPYTQPQPQSQQVRSSASSSESELAMLKKAVLSDIDNAIARGQLGEALKGMLCEFFESEKRIDEMTESDGVDYDREEERLQPPPIASLGRAFPVQRLERKQTFCRTVNDDDECLRCKSKISSGGGSSGRGADVLVVQPSVTVLQPAFKLPPMTCGFCYVHYKRHCQKLGRPWPRIEDPGFWHGHNTKDRMGNVECPELRAMMCPLCFASGSRAHTLKFCPLMNVSNY